MIKLILVDFDVKNANITLKICTYEVINMFIVYVVEQISFIYLYKQLRYEGVGGDCAVIGLMYNVHA